MSSNTQHNTDRPFGTNTASTGNTDSGLRSTERHGSESGTNTESLRTGIGYDSSPLAYEQGTTTAQYDSSRFGEEVPKQYHGHGQGTGVGHHKSHQEGSNYVGQQHTGVGGGDMKTTSDIYPRPTEQTTQAYSGVTGDPSGTTTMGYGTGDTTGRYGDTTTGFGTGTDNKYSTTGHHGEGHPSHHKQHLGGSHSQEVTDTGLKPSMTDKIVGGVEKVAGKMTSNTGMYQKGAERAAGETANVKKPTV